MSLLREKHLGPVEVTFTQPRLTMECLQGNVFACEHISLGDGASLYTLFTMFLLFCVCFSLWPAEHDF